jgi:multidrug efflux pump subunit AcrA (membrane-fusion protein)
MEFRMNLTKNMLLKTVINLGVALCLLVGLGCGKEGESRPHTENPAEKIKSVKVSAAKALPLRGNVEYVGALCANLKVNVTSEIGGAIEKLYFEKGDNVKKGQILAEIGTSSIRLGVKQAEAALEVARSRLRKTERGSRPEEILIASAAVERAEANLREAKRNFERINDLYEDSAVSNRDYDSAKRAVDTAQASLESAEQQLELAKQGPRIEVREEARANLKQAEVALAIAKDRLRKSRVKAPSDGIVAFRQVEEGEVVRTETIITQVVDTSKMKIKLSLAERDIHLLQRDKKFPFTVDAIPEEQFTCKLSFLSPIADTATRSFPAELLVDGPDPRMADGMTVRVELPLINQKRSIKVPSAWLSEEDGHMGLYVVEDGKASFRKVKLGSYYEQRVEILSGLSDNDLVITNPAGLKSGDSVKY